MQRQQLNGNKMAGWLLLTAGLGSQPNNLFLMLMYAVGVRFR